MWIKEEVDTPHPLVEWKHRYKSGKLNIFITKYALENGGKSFECNITVDLPNNGYTYNSVNNLWFKDESYIEEIKDFYGINI